MEELHSLENYLSDPEQIQKAVNELSKIGGSNPYDFVSRAAQKLITNKFSGATFSLQGRRKKESFQKLKLYELLTNASMTLFKDTTLKEQSIAKWIRRCTEREKGK
ncbi:hypothetical protein RN001_003682 [Aquatica leii]|uniref:DUF4806 domain-containing protein n=1 Tax=Aquatica leii TaxID=1421715 RepID=A0AAN7PP31_9COLE|nr:hypothetical protein RN001_003682 [Aquatica leii]